MNHEDNDVYQSAKSRESGMKTSPDPLKIQHYLEAHSHELQKFRETIGILHDRLSPVLGPESPNRLSDEVEEDSPERSEIARVILDQNSILRQMNRRVMEMIHRIEL